jgi:predicted transcriptional regulator
MNIRCEVVEDQARRCVIAKPDRRRASGQLEAEILAILQRAGTPLTPGEVSERLAGGLAYTTVVTILSRLHAKGVLVRNRSHRAYAYVPVADKPGLAARRMRQVLDGEPNRAAVLGHFVSDLSEQDEQLLRDLLLGATGGEPKDAADQERG